MLKKEKEWDDFLKSFLREEADKISHAYTPKKHRGVRVEDKGTSEGERTLNISTAYNSFIYFLNRI